MKRRNQTGFGLDGFATATAATFATAGMASVPSVAGVATVAVAKGTSGPHARCTVTGVAKRDRIEAWNESRLNDRKGGFGETQIPDPAFDRPGEPRTGTEPSPQSGIAARPDPRAAGRRETLRGQPECCAPREGGQESCETGLGNRCSAFGAIPLVHGKKKPLWPDHHGRPGTPITEFLVHQSARFPNDFGKIRGR